MLSKADLARTWAIAALLALAVFTVYWPVTRYGFTNYDDTHYVTENPTVRAGLTWGGVKWASTGAHVGNWHPLTWLSHMADCQLYGLKPGGHHGTNLVFHAANTVLLFLLLRSLAGAVWPSAAVAAFFGLHPLHVESVAWIAERKDVLSAFFGLLSLLAYAQYARAGKGVTGQAKAGQSNDPANRKGGVWWWVALGTFALGLMSKPMLVTWPCVMLLLDYWPLRRYSPMGASDDPTSGPATRLTRVGIRGLVWEKVPFFALSAAACVVAVASQRTAAAMAPLDQVPFSSRSINALVSYLKYLEKWMWPSDLAVIYPYVFHWPMVVVLLALWIVAGITVAVVWQRRQRPYLLVGWFWYLGTLVPVLGLVQVGSQSMADRYTYLPSIGVLIMLAWGLGDLFSVNRIARACLAFATAAALTLCALATRTQLSYWRNSETLFRHALEVTQTNPVAYNSLGFYYLERGNLDRAKSCFESALAINPTSAASRSGLARVMLGEGRNEAAVTEAEQAASLDPGLAEAQATLGQALMKQGRINEALAHYSATVRLRPDLASAHYNLANALVRAGQSGPALEQYRQALALDPGSADAHNNVAYLLVREGNLNEALRQFEEALRLQPDLWQARYGLGDALARSGQYEEAIRELSTVVRQVPDFTDGLARLAWIFAVNADPQRRDGAQAVQLAERAYKLTNQQQPGLLRVLAAAYAEAGRFDEAVRTAELARGRAEAAGQKELALKLQELADQFRSRRPFHEPKEARLR